MSADDFNLFYCLRETGWALTEEGNEPDSWVRIYEVRVYQGSPFGKESRHWNLIKTNPKWTKQQADLLEENIPRPQASRELSPESLSITTSGISNSKR
jgi:hypothetical protein